MRLFAGTRYDQPPKCDRCGALESECACSPPVAGRAVRLVVEKRKKGKVVTVIRGLGAVNQESQALLRRLKSQCGAGGVLHAVGLEIQGEHVERIRVVLTELGYHVRP